MSNPRDSQDKDFPRTLSEIPQNEPEFPETKNTDADHSPSDKASDTKPTSPDQEADWPTPTRNPESVAGLSLPLQIGRYLLTEEIAHGGMGAIFHAEDQQFNRPLAVKVLLIHASSKERFLKEAQIVGQLQHPGIAPVHELGELPDGRPFFSMKLIKGRTLAEILRERKSPEENLSTLIDVFEQICQTMAYAHSHKVIHRDLKPANIMVGAFGEVQVMDWGLAKVMNDPNDTEESQSDDPLSVIATTSDPSGTNQTRAGQIMGTPAYMAPEQACGVISQVDERSDVFGLGAIFCEILTGKPPYAGASPLQQAEEADLDDALERIEKSQVDAELISLAKDCLARERKKRPQHAGEVAERISNYQAEVQQRLQQEKLERERQALQADEEQKRLQMKLTEGRKRRRILIALIFVVVASSIGLAVLNVIANEQRQLAEQESKKASQKEAETSSINNFYENYVMAAARPKGWAGGSGKDLTLLKALDQASPKIAEAFAGQPELEAKVRNTLGMTYWYLGKFDSSGPQLEKAYEIRLKHLGENSVETLQSLLNLARQRWKEEKLVDAIAFTRKVLDGRLQVFGREHEETLFAKINLGLFLQEHGKYEEAEGHYRSSLEACKRVLGHEHYNTLYAQHDLGILLCDTGEQKEGLHLLQTAYEGRRRSLGEESPDTLRTMSVYASYLIGAGKMKEAEKLVHESLGLKIKVLGDAHLETYWGRKILAQFFTAKGNLKEAERVRREAVEIVKRKQGLNNVVTLEAMTDLGKFLRGQKKYTEASDILEQTVKASRETLGGEARLTLLRQMHFAWSLYREGKIAQSIELHWKTLTTQRRVLGNTHHNTLTTQNNLAFFLKQAERYHESEELFRKVVEIKTQRRGRDNKSTLLSQENLASVLVGQGKFTEAEKLYRYSFSARTKRYGPKHPMTLMAKSYLAISLSSQEKYVEAEKLFREVVSASV